VCAVCGTRIIEKLLKSVQGITLNGKPVLACFQCRSTSDEKHAEIFSREFREFYGVELAEIWGV